MVRKSDIFDSPRDSSGNPSTIMVNPVTGHLKAWDGMDFQVSDFDSSGDPSYYGFVDKDQNWYIMKQTASAGQLRYCSGIGNYVTAWNGRAGLTYDYFFQVF